MQEIFSDGHVGETKLLPPNLEFEFIQKALEEPAVEYVNVLDLEADAIIFEAHRSRRPDSESRRKKKRRTVQASRKKNRR